MPPASDTEVPDPELAVGLRRLWPQREHEASAVLSLLCRVGIHRWRRLDLTALVAGEDVAHRFWCSRVSIDGVT